MLDPHVLEQSRCVVGLLALVKRESGTRPTMEHRPSYRSRDFKSILRIVLINRVDLGQLISTRPTNFRTLRLNRATRVYINQSTIRRPFWTSGFNDSSNCISIRNSFTESFVNVETWNKIEEISNLRTCNRNCRSKESFNA